MYCRDPSGDDDNDESAINMDENGILSVRYNKLDGIVQKTIELLVPNGQEILPYVIIFSKFLDLHLKTVVDLLPSTVTKSQRDHFIAVYLAHIEGYLYRQQYVATGNMIRVFSGNYRTLLEIEKQLVIQKGFPIRVGLVGSAKELEDATPLKTVTNEQYSILYEKLIEFWGGPNQKKATKIMQPKLRNIHDFLPKHKIGDNFWRERIGRRELLPIYVRNEIHHPTIKGLLETPAFRRDKGIGYAIMEVWLSQS